MIAQSLEFTQQEDCIGRTGRLVLRRPRAEDAAGIAGLANDRLVAENTSLPFPYTPEQAGLDIASSGDGDTGMLLAWAETEGTAALLGAGHVRELEGVPELSFWIGSQFRGRGFGTELMRGLVDHVFDEAQADRISASCRVTNAAARRVIEKCGFQWAGCGLAHSGALRGSYPADRFRLDRRIWESLVAWGSARRLRWPGAAVSARAGAADMMVAR